MPTTEAEFAIEFLSYWHCGTGRGASASIDALVARDRLGLPIIPGKTLRGILRDAVRRYEALGHSTGFELELFGSQGFVPPGEEDEDPVHQPGTQPGRLAIASAQVEAGVRDWFEQQEALGVLHLQEVEALRATLFDTLSSTAIDDDTGTARDRSLRTIEVAVPLVLTTTINLLPGHPSSPSVGIDVENGWVGVLRGALPLIPAIGSGRTRGLGRCVISLKEKAS